MVVDNKNETRTGVTGLVWHNGRKVSADVYAAKVQTLVANAFNPNFDPKSLGFDFDKEVSPQFNERYWKEGVRQWSSVEMFDNPFNPAGNYGLYDNSQEIAAIASILAGAVRYGVSAGIAFMARRSALAEIGVAGESLAAVEARILRARRLAI